MALSSSRAPRLLAWLERSLPAEVLADGETRRRALLIAGTIWLTVIACLAVYPVLLGSTAGPALLVALVANTLSLALAFVGVWLLRSRRVLAAGHFVTALAYAGIVYGIVTSGGFASPSWVLLVIVPFVAAQMAGRTALHVWSGMCFIPLVGVFIAERAGFALPQTYTPSALVITSAAFSAITLLAVHLLSYLGEQARDDAIARAEVVSAQLARADLEVRRSNDRAREAAAASAAKTAFLATMSHELRTPLNAVIGYAELLIEESDEQGMTQMRTDLVRIATAGQHLRTLIEDILDLTRLEAERLELRRERFSAEELVHDVTSALEPLARRRRNVLEVVFDGSPVVADLDRDRVRQVLVHLVDNALKFTAQGRVTVRVRAGDDGPGRTLELVVEDTGIGIAEADQARIFEPFTQVDASPRRRYEGAGVGLSLCKQLVTTMGGTISVRSQLGRGSTFTVRLPAGPSAPAEPPALDVAC